MKNFPNDLPLVEEHNSSPSQASQTFAKSSIHTCQNDNDSDYLESFEELTSLNNWLTVQNTRIFPSRLTTRQFQIENYDFEDTEELKEEDQLSM